MKSKFSDQELRKFFADLKNAENKYPPNMMQSRRNVYIKQASVVLKQVEQGRITSTLIDSDSSTHDIFAREWQRIQKTSRAKKAKDSPSRKNMGKKK